MIERYDTDLSTKIQAYVKENKEIEYGKKRFLRNLAIKDN